MVISKIDQRIEYASAKFVDPDDLDYDAQLYQIEIFPGLEIIIALGKVKYTHVDKNVLYIPVYLTNNDKVVLQIGLYEFPSDIYTSLLDEDNDFDISLLENPLPLLYKSINESSIRREIGVKKTTKSPTNSPTYNLTSSESDKPPKDVFTELSQDSRVPNKTTIIQELFEEDDDDKPVMSDDVEETGFKEHSGHTWVEKFMKDDNYGIVDNEAGGDCLFATIRDAYSSIGKSVTVDVLRKIASDAATETVFLNFKEQYDMYDNEVKNLSSELSKLQQTNKEFKQKYSETKDRDLKKNLVEQSKPIITRFKQAKKEKKSASELLHEYRWMRGVDTLEKLKKKMRSCAFWAESWTLQTLELVLNVKLIVLSSFNYNYGDYDNILHCGDMAPDSMVEKGSFNPKFYIMLDYTGNHYKLVTYKRKHIFEFNDIPNKVKKMIIDKCMESKGKSIYDYIPKFKMIKTSMNTSPTSSLSPGDDAGPEDQGDRLEELIDEGTNLLKKPTFDEGTVFQFYSKSSDKPLPGKGAGEKIDPKNIKQFAELASMSSWRKVLSNFYIGPFKLDNRTWNSVEHYYHANKFKKGNPEFYEQFTLESGTDISKDPAFAKSAGGKTGKFKKKDWKRPKDIVIDEDFFSSGRNQQAMEDGQRAKYTQNETAKNVLLATKDAKLQHHVRGQPPIVFYDSMKIREELKKN
uniref:NADAR domain-containing protein n=1 Tax=viral metagenome TaxID=1070528 RepID=A0A6C0C5K9_9ZZZZ